MMNGSRTRQAERDGGLGMELLKGAAAGAAAVWVMDRLDWFAFTREDPRARAQTKRVRPGGMDPAHVAVSRTARKLGMKAPGESNAAGLAVHYGIGIGPGALYAAMRDRADRLGMARGPLYGLGLFLIQDELLNSVAGLTANPSRYPWQAHARGLAAHLVYGLTLDLALKALDAVSRSADHDNAYLHRDPEEARRFARDRELADMSLPG